MYNVHPYIQLFTPTYPCTAMQNMTFLLSIFWLFSFFDINSDGDASTLHPQGSSV